MIRFSIVIPLYNLEDNFDPTVNACLQQLCPGVELEVLLVDDCSTDNTAQQIQAWALREPAYIKALATTANLGPGGARNVGIDHASGEWLLFLDGDDRLAPGALKALVASIDDYADADAIGYDWAFDERSTAPVSRKCGRYDLDSLRKAKTDLIKDYLSLGMDGSVIYTAVRVDLLNKHGLRFRRGIHEDVDFIFKVCALAHSVASLDRVVYLKNNRRGSIVNTISKQHIDDYFQAWREIHAFMQSHHLWSCAVRDEYCTGLVGIVATRIREIAQRSDAGSADILYQVLYQAWLSIAHDLQLPPPVFPKTKYGMIAAFFQDLMSRGGEVAVAMSEYLQQIGNKSWSCYDLHNSLFLAPGEIRTCCKRFFINGKMKGDVAIVSVTKNDPVGITPQRILAAKKTLHKDINRAKCDACRDCPFLEFKDWGLLEELKVEHLSLEYHSVCNMKCAYCSETYYGGAGPGYDVEALITALFDKGHMQKLGSVVWGGGEPSLDKAFSPIARLVAERRPQVKQRILTNCVRHSPEIETLLAENKASLLTSVDAGTKATFQLIRGSTQFAKALGNMERYATVNPGSITIKYIFTDGNASLAEVEAFVGLMQKHHMLYCNFQISSDFKHEAITLNTATAMVVMYSLLIEAGCQLVYFDELLRQRFPKEHSEIARLKQCLKSLSHGAALADESGYKAVIVWGAGHQTQLFLENSHFFSQVKVLYIVDSTPAKIGTRFMGYEVRDPVALHDSEEPVLISAVQNSFLIRQRFLQMGLDEKRLIKGLVL